MLSNGCDCLIREYLTALEAHQSMNLDFKCLNNMLYQSSVITPEQLQMLNDNLDYYISSCEHNYGVETTKIFCLVILKMQLRSILMRWKIFIYQKLVDIKMKSVV